MIEGRRAPFGARFGIFERLFKKKKPKNVQKEIGPRYFSYCSGTSENEHSTYVKIKLHAEEGESIKFTFTPRSYVKFLSKDYVETLEIPQEIIGSESAWMTYNSLCSLIHKHEQSKGLFTEPGEENTDICLWIKPYEEPVVERDMNGIPRRKILRATTTPGRLRRRTMLVRWMMENSDWQEQLVLHYWNLPRKGNKGETLLPWFTLEVEYRKGARKRFCDDHHEGFCAVKAQGSYGCPTEVVDGLKKTRRADQQTWGRELGVGMGVVLFEALNVPVEGSTKARSKIGGKKDASRTPCEPVADPVNKRSSIGGKNVLPKDGPTSCASTTPHSEKIEEQQTISISQRKRALSRSEIQRCISI